MMLRGGWPRDSGGGLTELVPERYLSAVGKPATELQHGPIEYFPKRQFSQKGRPHHVLKASFKGFSE